MKDWETQYTKLISLFEKKGIEMMGLGEMKKTTKFKQRPTGALPLFLHCNDGSSNKYITPISMKAADFFCQHYTIVIKIDRKNWEREYKKLIPILKKRGIILGPLEIMMLGIQGNPNYDKHIYPDVKVPLSITKNGIGFEISLPAKQLPFRGYCADYIEDQIKFTENNT